MTTASRTFLLTVLLAAACGGPDESADASAASAGAADVAATSSALGGGTQTTTLSGAPLGGVVPQGEAKCDVFAPGVLEIRVRNVNLPDGTILTAHLAGYPVGSFAIRSRQGAATFPTQFQIGPNTSLVLTRGATVVLSRGAWR